MGTHFRRILSAVLVFIFQTVNVVYGQERRIDFRYERIVTDLKSFRMGADVDFSYNQTEEFPGQVISSPGCPNSHEGRQWVYYGNPVKCYLEGFRGPCPFGQRIFTSANSKYGVCNCNCFTEHVKTTATSSSVQFSYIFDSNNDILQNQFFLPNQRRVRSHYSNSYHGNRNRIRSASNMTPKSDESVRRIHCSTSKTSTTPTSTESPTDDTDPILEVSSYQLSPPSLKRDKNRYKFCYSDWYKRQVMYDSVRQECVPFLTQGPCSKGEWLVRNLSTENGVECEKRKCPEIISTSGNKTLQLHGGSFSYFDYRTQACYTEVYGNLQESFFATSGNIISGSNSRFCRDSGMRYSQILKTCVKDVSRVYQYKVIG